MRCGPSGSLLRLNNLMACQFLKCDRRLACLLFAVAVVSGCARESSTPDLPTAASWKEIEARAAGSTVRMGMWDGDPLINSFMKDWVAGELKNHHDITFEQISAQGNNLVSRLMVDLETNRSVGDFDLVWINGETFYQLRKLDALYGPFTDRLPNNQDIDWDSRFVAVDFQQPVEGYECPWGNVQFTLIYNSDTVGKPPKTVESLRTWILQNPGRFTFDTGFTGLTFLKCLLYDFAGGPESLNGPFDEEKYQDASAKLWTWLRDIRPSLWREGKTFPEGVAQLHQLFSNGEVDFTMSNNDGEVDNKVSQGILPDTSRAYVLDSGTIRNSHYLGIPVNAPNKAGAMVVANFLISWEAQVQKSRPSVWGDGTVLSMAKLPDEWRRKLEFIEGRERVAPRTELEDHALMEPAPEIMIRLDKELRSEIIERAP